jgi:hypothetical protein
MSGRRDRTGRRRRRPSRTGGPRPEHRGAAPRARARRGAGRHSSGDRRDLRPGVGGCAVLRHRVGAPATRVALAAAAGRALVARTAPGGHRVRGGRPAPSRGRLVYSVCTFPRAETDAACDALVKHRPELEPEPIDGPGRPLASRASVAASARFRRHVHRGLPQAGLTGRVR